MSLRRTMLTAAKAAVALIVGRAVGSAGLATVWAVSYTTPATSSTTLSKVTFSCATAGRTLYFFAWTPGVNQVAAVDGPFVSVVGSIDYAVSLPISSGQFLGVQSSSAAIGYRYDSAGGSGFGYVASGNPNPGTPVVGSGVPLGFTFNASPNSLHLAGFA